MREISQMCVVVLRNFSGVVVVLRNCRQAPLFPEARGGSRIGGGPFATAVSGWGEDE